MSVLGLLFAILILCLIFGLIWYAIGLIPLDAPFMKIARVVVLFAFVIILVGILGGAVPLPIIRW